MTLVNCSSSSALADKERQLVWLLVRQLGEAQAAPHGQARSERLWQEVAALEIDPERVIQLLYGGHDLNDREALAALDPSPVLPRQSRSPTALFRRQPRSAAGPRSAPRAAAPTHPAAR